MINFLHPLLEPKVECSTISEDGHHIRNLISKNLREKNAGFMAFRVTKPPVEITFELAHSISVNSIKLWTNVGSLKSTGFEIYIKSKEEYIKVGQYRNVTSDLLEFYKFDSNNSSISTMAEGFTRKEFFKTRAIDATLSTAKFLQIKIIQTRKCAPVIKKIEIWGNPSVEVNPIEVNRIYNIWEQVINPYYTLPTLNSNSGFKINETKVQISNKIEFPDEYLDAITYEVMIFPMILPSGKVVDQSTIDKIIAAEGKWGRPPSDPFTGQEFTSERRPIFDSALKACIDKYLIDHSHLTEIKALPRTLGKRINDCDNLYFGNKNEYSKRQKQEAISIIDHQPKSDINQLIKDAHKNVTKYSTTKKAINKEDNSCCLKCRRNLNLYKVESCNHIVCRNCIKDLIEKKKCFCEANVDASNLIKLYT